MDEIWIEKFSGELFIAHTYEDGGVLLEGFIQNYWCGVNWLHIFCEKVGEL